MASPPAPLASRKAKSALAAQEFLTIEEIREDILTLKGGRGIRAVVMVSALNFALKSEQEQDALTFQYENFLNALDFPLQIVVQSRHLNIQPYLETLAGRQKEETNELLKIQIGEYIEFIRTFVDLTKIVSKTFFVVVPFQPSVAERHAGGLLRGFLGRGRETGRANGDQEFAQYKIQLLQRVDTVTLGLRRLGLRAMQLQNDELMELFYGLYNPAESQAVRAVGEG